MPPLETLSLPQLILAALALLLAPYIAFKVVKWVVKKIIWAVIFSIISFGVAVFMIYQKFFA